MARVIVLVDMDCFYAQVEQRDQPSLWGKPVGVLQYSANGQSGLIAVSYEARPFGVKRGMTAKQCKELCPDMEICLVPQGEHADKADIQKYRDASSEVFAVLGSVDPCIIVERASVDEAFLDCTDYVEGKVRGEKREQTIQRLLDPSCLPTSFIVDGEEVVNADIETQDDNNVDEETREREKRERQEKRRTMQIEEFIEKCRSNDECLKIALAAEFAERLREKVREKTQFYCSAGVANNKMMAKLVCAAHKPRKQSFVPPGSAMGVLRNTQISSIRGLGGKLGTLLFEKLGIKTMGELSSIPLPALTTAFPQQVDWLVNIAKGHDNEGVKARATQTSVAVGKNFPGKLALSTTKDIRFWLTGLTKELMKRLINDKATNRRIAQNIVVHLTTDVSTSRTVRVGVADEKEEVLLEKLWQVILSLRKGHGQLWDPPIFNISLSAGRFLEGLPSKEQSIVGWMERRRKELVDIEKWCRVIGVKEGGDAAAKEKKRLIRVEGIEEGEEEEDEGKEEKEEEEEEEEDQRGWLEIYEDSFIVDDEEPGTSMSRPYSRPPPVRIDDSSFELDEEGWQIWPQMSGMSSLVPSVVPSAVASSLPSEVDETSREGTESRCSIDEKSRGSGSGRREHRKIVGESSGSDEVSNAVLMELPENLRKEVLHLENLRDAKAMKEKRALKEATRTKQQPMKRKAVKEEKEDVKKSKSISDFFGGNSKK